jgi:hypothetical protein
MNKATKAAVLLLLAAVLILPLGSCKKADEEPQPVTFTISVYNHMKAGVQKTLTKSGLLNSTISLTFAEAAIAGVSQNYMVAREPNMGKRLGLTERGEGTMSIATGSSTSIDVYRFNLENASDALFADVMSQGAPRLYAGRNSKWFRKNFDGYTPNNEFQSEWENAFNDINEAFQNPFPVGSCTSHGGVDGTDWSYGYGFSVGGGGDKSDTRKAIWTDSNSLHNYSYAISRINMDELWELLGGINDIGGNSSFMLICNGTRLNPTGKNLGRFYMLMGEPKQ